MKVVKKKKRDLVPKGKKAAREAIIYVVIYYFYTHTRKSQSSMCEAALIQCDPASSSSESLFDTRGSSCYVAVERFTASARISKRICRLDYISEWTNCAKSSQPPLVTIEIKKVCFP